MDSLRSLFIFLVGQSEMSFEANLFPYRCALVDILGFQEDVWWGLRNSRQAKRLILFSKMKECEEELKVNGFSCVPSSWMPLGVKVHLGTSGLLPSSCGSMLEAVSSFALDELASNLLMEAFWLLSSLMP